MTIFTKVKTKAEQFVLNQEWKANYIKAQKMNRHSRRMLGKINKIGMIPKKP
jgi:hypothetical protein